MPNGFRLAAIITLASAAAPAAAEDLTPLTFQMSWKAQIEQGGYYNAVAKGYYEDCGLDVTIRAGGPGIDTTRLLVTGAVDVSLVSQNDGVMRMNEAGFPAKAVMAGFQVTPSILLYHAESGIAEPADMAGHPIMISQPSRNTYWPFLKENFGLTDEDLRTYSGQIAVWMQDEDAIQQGFLTNEPFRIEEETGTAPDFFMLSDLGYRPYSSVVAVPQTLIDENPDAVECLVKASQRGWQDVFQNPEDAMAAVKEANPENSDELMANALKVLEENQIVVTADTPPGTMTAERWKEHADALIKYGLFPDDFDVEQSYTLEFLD